MKKIILLALLSTSVSANEVDHFYVGGNLLVGNNTELDSGFEAIDKNNDLGGGVYAGYNFAVHPSVDFGVELEYQHFGKAEFTEDVNLKGNAFYINARPKFINKGNNLYSALILGVGSLKGEINAFGLSESKFSYQAGLEVGYMINNVDLAIGYRYRAAEFDGVDTTIQGVTVGMRYNF